jgi:hypothetical protein
MLNLVTVVGENTHMLPHMIKHYKDIVDKIYVVVYRQNPLDGILEQVINLGIKPFKVVTEEKYNWERVTELYNEVKSTKPDEWWIVSDDDELQVYPRPIEDIIESCERNGYDFVTGGFIDRIGTNGTFPEVFRDTNILEAFPLMGFFRHPMSGACPNKVTLMKGHQQISSGQHYAIFKDGSNSWGSYHPKRMPIDECFTQVHHFKWDSSVIDRIKAVADVNKPYAYSSEYQLMYDNIKKSNWKINIDKSTFLVERSNNSSYIDYNDFDKWSHLIQTIVNI